MRCAIPVGCLELGRSGLLAAAVLMHAGRDARQAFALVASRRGLPLPETRAQGSWLAANQSAINGGSNSIACR
jgi:hypothetical protein